MIETNQTAINSGRLSLDSLSQIYRFDTVLGMLYHPNLSMLVEHELHPYLVKTNMQGFRTDWDLYRDTGANRRVLVFGDSYTAGDGVSNGSRFTDLIQKNSRGTELVNLAVSGSSLDQNFTVFSNIKKKIKYDEILLVIQVENIIRLQSSTRIWSGSGGKLIEVPKPTYVLTSDRKQLAYVSMNQTPRFFEKTASSKMKDLGRDCIELLVPTLYKTLHRRAVNRTIGAYSDQRSDGWQLMRNLINLFIIEAQTPVRVVLLPLFEQVSGDVSYGFVRQRFTEFESESGVEICHVYDSVCSLPPAEKKRLCFQSDPHPTDFCHSVYAQIIASYLN